MAEEMKQGTVENIWRHGDGDEGNEIRVHTKKVSELADAILNLVLFEMNTDDHPAKAARTELPAGAGEAGEVFVIRVADDPLDKLKREWMGSYVVYESGRRIDHGRWEERGMG